MALTLYPTFTPSGYITFVAPPYSQPSATQIPPIPIPPAYQQAATVALPAGSSPASVLINNVGVDGGYVWVGAATASPTSTQATIGSFTIVVSSATGILTGQAVFAAGIPAGTIVNGVSGTTISISNATTSVLSATATDFVTQVTEQTGIAIFPKQTPLVLAYAKYISAIAFTGGNTTMIKINAAVGV